MWPKQRPQRAKKQDHAPKLGQKPQKRGINRAWDSTNRRLIQQNFNWNSATNTCEKYAKNSCKRRKKSGRKPRKYWQNQKLNHGPNDLPRSARKRVKNKNSRNGARIQSLTRQIRSRHGKKEYTLTSRVQIHLKKWINGGQAPIYKALCVIILEFLTIPNYSTLKAKLTQEKIKKLTTWEPPLLHILQLTSSQLHCSQLAPRREPLQTCQGLKLPGSVATTRERFVIGSCNHVVQIRHTVPGTRSAAPNSHIPLLKNRIYSQNPKYCQFTMALPLCVGNWNQNVDTCIDCNCKTCVVFIKDVLVHKHSRISRNTDFSFN